LTGNVRLGNDLDYRSHKPKSISPNLRRKLIGISAAERVADYFQYGPPAGKRRFVTTCLEQIGHSKDSTCKESRTMARKLDKPLWQPYFDVMSRALLGKRAEIEVVSLNLGDQIEAEWAPLLGITYDPKDDLLEVALEGHDHLINKPREIYVEDQELELASVEVIDAEDVRQIIMLRDPLMLPAPAQAGAKAGRTG
jgi:hypothetical protein